jgi:hypothetical protein
MLEARVVYVTSIFSPFTSSESKMDTADIPNLVKPPAVYGGDTVHTSMSWVKPIENRSIENNVISWNTDSVGLKVNITHHTWEFCGIYGPCLFPEVVSAL